MHLTDISTPAALIDTTRMLANIELMQQRMNGHGVSFRPHVKTAKCLRVAAAQRDAGAKGITVSTLKEAEQFFAGGFDDITYAAGITPAKLPRALELMRRGCTLHVLVDSEVMAHAVAAYGREHDAVFSVLVEIDTDGHRSGVPPDAAELTAIAGAIVSGGSRLAGVLTHAGSSYALSDQTALEALAERERAGCVMAAGRLKAEGHGCPVVSVGSTPTAAFARDLGGVTEVRAGVYVFFDLVMRNIGVCGFDNIALSVLTTVMGHQKEKGWAIVDAGWMAMSRDRGTAGGSDDFGYGQVCDENGVPCHGYSMSEANQEHGIISLQGGCDAHIAERFPIGTLLRVLPNHACATAAQFPAYRALLPGGASEDWPRFYGW